MAGGDFTKRHHSLHIQRALRVCARSYCTTDTLQSENSGKENDTLYGTKVQCFEVALEGIAVGVTNRRQCLTTMPSTTFACKRNITTNTRDQHKHASYLAAKCLPRPSCISSRCHRFKESTLGLLPEQRHVSRLTSHRLARTELAPLARLHKQQQSAFKLAQHAQNTLTC